MSKPVSGRSQPSCVPPLDEQSPAGKPEKRRGDKRGAKKGKFGQQPFVATSEQRIQVEAYVAAGAQQQLIADYMGISEDTLARHFRAELDNGKHRALTKIGGSLIAKALAGDDDLGKFIMARIGGWKAGLEHSGPGGKPIEHRDMTQLTDEQIAALAALDDGDQ